MKIRNLNKKSLESLGLRVNFLALKGSKPKKEE